MSVAVFVALSSHPKYSAATTVLMVADSSDPSATQTSTTTARPVASNDLPAIATGAVVLSRLRSDLHESVSLEALRSRISAKTTPDSNIMNVDFTAKSAEQALAGANWLGAEITRAYQELATARFDSLIADFNSQLSARRLELAQLDGRLGEIVYQHLIALRAQRDELQANLSADAALARSTDRLVSNVTSLATKEVVQSDPVYAHVVDQYAKDEAELKRLSAYGSERYPGLIELRHTVAREAQIVEAAKHQATQGGLVSNSSYVAALDGRTRSQGQVSSDQAKIDAVQSEMDALQKQLGRKGIAATAVQLHRDHDNAEASYAIIASRLANAIADRAQAASTGSVVVLDRAQFASRSMVGSGTIAGLAIAFLSVWLALTLAVTLDNTDERFRDRVTIETVYGAPVIGSVV
jgi:capsular polysaccharide biosynthesis protein